MSTLESVKNALLVTLVIMLVYVLYKRMIKVLYRDKVMSQYPSIGNQLTVENDHGVVTVELFNPTHLIIEVFDSSNNVAVKLAEGEFNRGAHRFKFELSALKPGKYYYKVTSPNQQSSQYFDV
ncbi:MAG: hypothetical protein ACOYLH_02860 [Flavobacteriales bacterium]